MNRCATLFLVTCVSLSACGSKQSTTTKTTPVQTIHASETARLNAFFEEVFERNIKRSPFTQTYLGIKTDYDKWDDLSDARTIEDFELTKGDLDKLRGFDVEALEPQAKLSYRLFEYNAKQAIEGHKWRFHNYPINQMHGLQAQAPAFLINFHRIDDENDAQAYISRLRGLLPAFEQVREGLRTRQEKGIVPPKFVFPKVIDDCRNILKGRPFEDVDTDSTLLADFRRKVDALSDLPTERKTELVRQTEAALLEAVKPAYLGLIQFLQAQEQVATTDDGVWKLPDGDAYYNYALKMMTTTEMSASEIHDLGLAEVDRIHGEMRAIMKQVNFQGNLETFFRFMRDDKRFFYPNTDEGRDKYLTEATALIDAMKARLDELFFTKPKAAMIVKRVEAFREKSAGKAFYSGPTPDGSRPGTYYANLYDMNEMPTYQMEALAYHEGIPGHHMQIAIAQELENIPQFRRFGQFTAYSEGWGLYAERIPKEMGLYEDPYADFGRLAMELWRACRLVVDTGIHYKKWTRQKAIDYLNKNTPNPEGDVDKAIERYIVTPGQATAYKIGMNKLLSLREMAKGQLGDKFDIREFHDIVLTSGPVPLQVLENVVKDWLSTK